MKDAEDAILAQKNRVQNLILQEQALTEQLRELIKQVFVLAEQLREVTESRELEEFRKITLEAEDRARNQPEWKKGSFVFPEPQPKESVPQLKELLSKSRKLEKLRKLAREMEDEARNQPEWMRLQGSLLFAEHNRSDSLPDLSKPCEP